MNVYRVRTTNKITMQVDNKPIELSFNKVEVTAKNEDEALEKFYKTMKSNYNLDKKFFNIVCIEDLGEYRYNSHVPSLAKTRIPSPRQKPHKVL